MTNFKANLACFWVLHFIGKEESVYQDYEGIGEGLSERFIVCRRGAPQRVF